jgi:hypothetical protein
MFPISSIYAEIGIDRFMPNPGLCRQLPALTTEPVAVVSLFPSAV